MHVDEIAYSGALNLVGGFWAQVRKDLAYVPGHADGRRVHTAAGELIARATTLAWLLDDGLRYAEDGTPDSFRAWCRFGGLNLDPGWWRACLLSGEVPSYFKYEDE